MTLRADGDTARKSTASWQRPRSMAYQIRKMRDATAILLFASIRLFESKRFSIFLSCFSIFLLKRDTGTVVLNVAFLAYLLDDTGFDSPASHTD